MYVLLIPAYRPDKKYTEFVKLLMAADYTVVSVDDGSGEDCRPLFDEAKSMGVDVIGYEENHGKGYALRYGIKHITENYPDAEGIITADCDGQHTIKDLRRVEETLKANPNKVVTGGRFAEGVKIPFRSALGNGFSRWQFKIATGVKVRDTQTGLRGFPISTAPYLLTAKGDRYEYEMNVLLRLHDWGYEIIEIPIETIYLEDNATSHYHPIRDSVRVVHQVNKYAFGKLFRKIKNILKFASTSMTCFAIDYILYNFVFLNIYPKEWSYRVAIAYASARVISATINYFLNAKLIFKQNAPSMYVRYIIWAAFVAAIGSLGSNLLHEQAGVAEWLCKLLIDTPLWLVSYFGQKLFVFKKFNFKKNSKDSKNDPKEV